MLPTLSKECSEYLNLSQGCPLLKNLPIHNDGFRKVKVRKKKNLNSNFIELFNEVFEDHDDLYQRAVFASSNILVPDPIENVEPFYIFPIDGFKFVYAENVSNTSNTYKEMFDKLMQNLDNEQGIEIFLDVLRFNYKKDDLVHGIKSGSEIIIYGIPYYYAIRKSIIDDYRKFFYDE
jgi:hypothetical protein